MYNYSQKWLAIISLDHPSGSEFGSGESKVRAKRKLGTQNKYETKALHWNPNSNKQNLIASTVNIYLHVIIHVIIHVIVVISITTTTCDTFLITTSSTIKLLPILNLEPSKDRCLGFCRG